MQIKALILLATPIVLSACGGSSNQETVKDGSNSTPVQITSKSWQNTTAKLNSDATIKAETFIRRQGGTRTNPNFVTYMRTEVKGSTVGRSVHKQFFIDIDNNSATGFQFNSQLWSAQSGVDYLIQDGELYKSTANDASWSWKWVKTLERTNQNNTRIDIRLSKQHSFEPLCNDLNIGYIELDSNWSVQDYYPKANHMSKQKVSFCSVYNASPKITLLGVNVRTLVFELNDPLYADPGATASDLEDGDISSKIKVTSNVNIHKVGNYTIKYEVTDSQGRSAKKTRLIRVFDPQTSGITVDGNSSDWANINPIVNYNRTQYSGHFSSSWGHYLKATDTSERLYFIADSYQSHSNAPASANGSTVEYWQFLIDADNNSATGYNGYDYLIENGLLYEFSGINSQEWSWINIKTNDVAFARGFRPIRPSKGRVEVSVPKVLLRNLAEEIKVSFYNYRKDWRQLSSFGNSYKLKK